MGRSEKPLEPDVDDADIQASPVASVKADPLRVPIVGETSGESSKSEETELWIPGPAQTGFPWLVFDAVGTVIHPEPSVSAAYHASAVRHGSRLTREVVRTRFTSAFRASELRDLGEAAGTTSEEIERERWRWIVGEVVDDVPDVEACFLDLFDHFGRTASWRCFDDVSTTLRRLAEAGYRLAVASNFDNRLFGLVEGLPALGAIERTIVSSQVGSRKPSRAFYESVLGILECQRHEAMMIGDDFDNDVAGARNAGLAAVFLNRDRDSASSAGEGIRTLNELPAYLRTWAGRTSASRES